MTYVGIDQHRKFSVFAVMDEKGNLISQKKIDNRKEDKIREFFAPLKQPINAVLEAGRSWYWLVNLLREEGVKVTMANPLKVRAIAEAKIKTDTIDAKILAHLLRSNLVPEAFIPDQHQIETKELLRYRVTLVRMQTALKNKIHAILAKHNIHPPMSDLFGRQGRKFLESLTLRPRYRQILDEYLTLLDILKEKILAVNNQIRAQVLQDKEASLLTTIPGIGYFSALTIVSEIGKISRFKTSKKLCAYAGLVPSTRQSADKVYHGKLTKQGSPYLRWVLTEAAQKAVVKDPSLRSFYLRILKRRGKPKAKIAVARKILTICFRLLTDKRPYRIQEGTDILSGH